jgi:pimeloyl-ACP methyl ester carboxylesterase
VEQLVAFEVEQSRLHGVWHVPEGANASGPVVVLLHGWAGSRIGPHRMFVHMARRLAAGGCPCLRFDFRGRGDSEGATARASIRSMVEDTRAAVDFFAPLHPGRRIILLGICSGCKVAIATACGDPRVSGLALWSAEPMGPMRNAASKARKSGDALRAYARKLLRPETWRKLVTFRVNLRMVRKAVASQEYAGRTEIEDERLWLERFRSFRGRALFIYGTNDPETATARAAYASLCRHARIPFNLHGIEGANHSFYSLAWERQVIELTDRWIGAA